MYCWLLSLHLVFCWHDSKFDPPTLITILCRINLIKKKSSVRLRGSQKKQAQRRSVAQTRLSLLVLFSTLLKILECGRHILALLAAVIKNRLAGLGQSGSCVKRGGFVGDELKRVSDCKNVDLFYNKFDLFTQTFNSLKDNNTIWTILFISLFINLTELLFVLLFYRPHS